MVRANTASASGPADSLARSLAEARAQARTCTRCPLYANATQTVFGEGPASAAVMFIGEQPGDKEDLAGKPFVGPAGILFDRLLGEAGIERQKCYVTNAVKHFKNEPRGKIRLHKRPNAGEVKACRWWLKQETDLIRPELIVALGATAAYAVTGKSEGILRRRGNFETAAGGTPVLICVHPSSLLRMPDRAEAEKAAMLFRRDLQRILEIVPGAKAA